MNINRNHIIKIFPKHSKILNLINNIPLFFEYIKQNETMGMVKIDTNRFEVFDHIINGIKNPIDFFEFGVFKGDVIKYWAKNINNSSKFFGFDSFEGLPEDFEGNTPQGFFSTNGKIPDTDDDRITFIKGWFNDTLPEFLKVYDSNNNKVIHMDADLYPSTLFVLTQMHSYLKKDDIIIFDEFGNTLHEFRAWCDYTNAYNVKFETLVSYRNFTKVAFRIL